MTLQNSTTNSDDKGDGVVPERNSGKGEEHELGRTLDDDGDSARVGFQLFRRILLT